MMWENTQGNWFLAVNRFAEATPALHAPMRLYAKTAWPCSPPVAAGGLVVGTPRREPADHGRGPVGARGALLALGLNQPLVNLVHESRPYTVFPHALVLVAHSQDYAFPSDHAVMAGAVTMACYSPAGGWVSSPRPR